jgi:hypothetical protein
MTKTDEQRRQELIVLYKNKLGWPEDDINFRVEEKERDASNILQKIIGQIDALVENVSLLALDNNQLLILKEKIDSVKLLIDSEITNRI